jgi:uncharacterized protein (DUF1778 family)
MAQSSGGEPEKPPYSGRLPFRTQPATHELIYRAAKKKGVSINSWMSTSLAQLAQWELERDPDEGSDSTGLAKQLMDRDPQVFLQLVDRVQQAIKPEGIQKALIWMSYVQALMQQFDRLQARIEVNRGSLANYLEDLLLPQIQDITGKTQNQNFLILLSITLQSLIAQSATEQGRSRQVLDMEPLTEFIKMLEKLQYQFKSDSTRDLLLLIIAVAKALSATEGVRLENLASESDEPE